MPCGCFLVTFVLTLLSLKETVTFTRREGFSETPVWSCLLLDWPSLGSCGRDWLLLSRGALGTRMT